MSMYGPERLDLGIILESMFQKERKKIRRKYNEPRSHERENK
jgi:hypothetical protein